MHFCGAALQNECGELPPFHKYGEARKASGRYRSRQSLDRPVSGDSETGGGVFRGPRHSIAQARQQAFAWIGQQVQIQASLLAYIDVFWTLMLISAAAVPLALVLRKIKLGARAPMAH
jgi:hypothetical protein